jgi:hypothetical protein
MHVSTLLKKRIKESKHKINMLLLLLIIITMGQLMLGNSFLVSDMVRGSTLGLVALSMKEAINMIEDISMVN